MSENNQAEFTKNKKLYLIAFVVLLAVIIAGVGIGCWFGGKSYAENAEASDPRGVVSYTSVDSTIYSSTAEVVGAVADTVVEIRTETVKTQWGAQYIVSGAGSGVIVGEAGGGAYYIITNNHVIEGAQTVTVTLRNGTGFDADIVASDVAGDIAVVKIASASALPVAVWGNSDTLEVGEDLIAIGNPLGSLGGTVTKGILSAKERSISVNNYTMTLLQTDTAINPGNSGGGLFNMRGELIGVVNAKTTDEEIEGICFAIPAKIARAIYADLIENGYVVGRAEFGITVTAASSNSGTVVYVTAVSDAASGFAVYDKIIKIGDKTVSSVLDYNDALALLTAGDEVSVTVCHGRLVSTIFGNNISFDTEETVLTVTAKQVGA